MNNIAEVNLKKVALIGFGAMARTVVRILLELGDKAPEVVGILVLPESAAKARRANASHVYGPPSAQPAVDPRVSGDEPRRASDSTELRVYY